MRPLRVRLVQANSEDDENHFGLSVAPAAAPPDIIVWPEYSFVSDPRRSTHLWKRLADLARERRCYLLFGAEDQFDAGSPNGFRNTAYLLNRDGALVGTHVKNHTVHFFRDGVPGTQARALQTDLGRIGVAICFDMDYPDVARRLTEDGAELFLVPNMDPEEWGPIQRAQHRAMFRMRAIECGRELARADVAAGTSAVNRFGGEIGRVPSSAPAVLDVTLRRSRELTPFARGGWRFGPLCFVGTLAALAGRLFAHRRRRSGPAEAIPDTLSSRPNRSV